MATVTRAKSVSFKAFLTAWVVGCKAGKTQAEIAADVGMNLSSFRTRLVAVRKLAVEAGKPFPEAKRASGERTSGGETRVAVMSELLDALDATETVENTEVAPVAEGEASA